MLEVSIAPEARPDHTGLSAVPVLIIILLSVVLNMVNPFAGNMMEFCWDVVILGNKKPLVVLLTSSIALVSARLPSALIETFCANKFGEIARNNKDTSKAAKRFFINKFLCWIFVNGTRKVTREYFLVYSLNSDDRTLTKNAYCCRWLNVLI